MALLDAIPCSWSACYANSTAITAGIALNSDNKLLVYQGSYWKQQSNLANLLAKKMAIYHTDTTIVNYAVGQAGNGLFYDQNNRVDYFGDAQTYCANIGMRLPAQTNNETDVFSSYNGYNSNGIPNTEIMDYQGTYMNWSSTSSNSYTGQNTIWCYGKYYWVAEVGLNVRLSYRCIK